MKKVLITTGVLVLLAAVGGQSYFLYRLSGQVESLRTAGPPSSGGASVLLPLGGPSAALFDVGLRVPVAGLREENDRFVVRVELPGADETSLGVSLDGDRRLTISASAGPAGTPDSGGEGPRHGAFFSYFERTFTLPQAADPAGLSTEYEAGVLTVTIPKKTTI